MSDVTVPAGQMIDMMRACEREIRQLRAEIDYLRPKADAYQSMQKILGLLPRQSEGASPDLSYTLKEQISKLEDRVKAAAATPAAMQG